MKVLIRQFLGTVHSWSVIGWAMADSLLKQGHQVHLFSTNGIANFPEHLKPYLVGYVEEDGETIQGHPTDPIYDAQFSYTCMKNFPILLGSGNKNRFGSWVYEWNGKNVLPTGFAKNHQYCDYILSPSQFGKDVYLNSGVPEEKVVVVPHGIDVSAYQKNTTINLKTQKKFKILATIAQNHLRKNIPGLLDAYGKAFNKKDDVCLILKAKEKTIKHTFDVSLNECLSFFKKKYPNHAEVKVLSEFIPDMSELYRSVDCVYTMTHCEGYYMPGLEGLAAGKMSIAPNWGGQVDFLNDSNSLLVSGKETRANPKSMYWETNNNAIWFQPSVEDAADKLQYAYHHYPEINARVESNKSNIHVMYSWDNIMKNILSLCV